MKSQIPFFRKIRKIFTSVNTSLYKVTKGRGGGGGGGGGAGGGGVRTVCFCSPHTPSNK